MAAILLLICSNVFMNFAWYGHLKHRQTSLFLVILISWGIAFFEYCFQVPANRIGSYQFSLVQLKTIQEVITLVVFCIFSFLYFDQKLTLNHAIGFALLILATYFIYKPT